MRDQVYRTIVARRTIRRFKQLSIARPKLVRLIDAARLSPSAANLQALEFIVITDKGIGARVFPNLRWAGYIAPYGSPGPRERKGVDRFMHLPDVSVNVPFPIRPRRLESRPVRSMGLPLHSRRPRTRESAFSDLSNGARVPSPIRRRDPMCVRECAPAAE